MKSFYRYAPLLGLLSAASAHAQAPDYNDIRLGEPSAAGNGCPSGSVATSLSPDAKSLSILFDNFIAEAGGNTGKTLDRKSCNVAIPVHIPSGYSVSIFKIDYRGYVAIPQAARGVFEVEYFFANNRGPRYTKTYDRPTEQSFTLSNDLMATATSWSNCGEQVTLRTNANIRVQSDRGQYANMTLDSADISSGVVYQLQWRRCGAGGNVGNNSNNGGYRHDNGGFDSGNRNNRNGNSGGYDNGAYDDRYGNNDRNAPVYRDEAVYQEPVYTNRSNRNPRGADVTIFDPNRRMRSYCSVVNSRNAYGQVIFRVIQNGTREIIETAYRESEAIRISRTDRRCVI